MHTLEQKISILKDDMLEMMRIVKKQVQKSMEALLNNDLDLASEIRAIEDRINAMELNIDLQCEDLLALYKPVAIDLRFILSVMKINSHLERIADHANGIAIYLIKSNQPSQYTVQLNEVLQIEEMFSITLSMLDDTIHSFNTENTKMARWVFGKDRTLNQLNLDNSQRIVSYVKSIPTENIEESMFHFFALSKKIERSGDLIKNIAEEIIFFIEAKIVKHTFD